MSVAKHLCLKACTDDDHCAGRRCCTFQSMIFASSSNGIRCCDISANASCSIRRARRSIAMAASACLRWMAGRRSFTARTCATWPSFSWTTRPCTMTWTCSYFTSSVSVMKEALTLSGESAFSAMTLCRLAPACYWQTHNALPRTCQAAKP